MSKLNYQYDLQNLTPANAAPVEANFTRTEQHINQEVIERDGSVAMRAQLKLVGDPIANLDAAPKQYVDQVIPVGLITMWGAAAAPANGKWLLCDGAAVETALYPELFAVIGYAWGGSGGSFNTPNLSGRVAIGPSATHPLAQVGGSEDSSLPAHTHPIDHTHAATGATDTNHLHGVNNHTHRVDLYSSYDGDHNHYASGNPAVNVIGASAPGTGMSAGPGGPEINYFTFTSTNGNHRHATNGDSGGAAPNTGYMNQNVTHTHTVPAMAGASGQTGIAPAGTNMPPFLSIPYIIRCK